MFDLEDFSAEGLPWCERTDSVSKSPLAPYFFWRYDLSYPAYVRGRKEDMTLRAMSAAFAVLVSSATLIAADNPLIGTWTQNLSKSKYTPAPGPINPATLRFEQTAEGEVVKVARIGADGNPITYSYKGLYDGTRQKVLGSPYGDTVTLKRVDSQTTEVNWIRNGKVSRTSTRTLSKDGKTMTITAKGTDEKGQEYNSVSVLEKQ
jgi:hypothetical protein